jgi:signal transduction histidine kinase
VTPPLPPCAAVTGEPGRGSLRLPARFLSELTHELKNHLGASQAAAYLLGARGKDLSAEREQSWLGAIREGLTGTGRVLEQLEALERAAASDFAVPAHAIDFPSWLASLQDRAGERAGVRPPLHVEGDVPTGGWHFAAAALESAADAVLDNAIRFAEPGTPITMSVRADGGTLVIVIRNQGEEIPAAELPRIFEPFFQGRRAKKLGGSGLGLAIAEAAVTRAGGSIRHLRSSAGTEFVLQVPAQPAK